MKPRRACRTPGCRRPGGRGRFGNFCQPCADRLDEIRGALLDRDGEKYRIYGTRPGYLAADDEEARDAA